MKFIMLMAFLSPLGCYAFALSIYSKPFRTCSSGQPARTTADLPVAGKTVLEPSRVSTRLQSAAREATSDKWEATYFSPAKINLFLRVMGKRPDGFHELASLFQVSESAPWQREVSSPVLARWEPMRAPR